MAHLALRVWHISHYAYLIDKLKRTPEGAGTVLDNSAIVFMPEAGHGVQLNDGVSVNQTHSVDKMILMVAGRAGGLAPGRHIVKTGPSSRLAPTIPSFGISTPSLRRRSSRFTTPAARGSRHGRLRP